MLLIAGYAYGTPTFGREHVHIRIHLTEPEHMEHHGGGGGGHGHGGGHDDGIEAIIGGLYGGKFIIVDLTKCLKLKVNYFQSIIILKKVDVEKRKLN